ncbi:MAG TPA: hypothetical protein ENJ01_04695 [Gammaproteobacteria bacterium]|nr:hypothetical protein [Gammaproteobacteria bacterium]
MKRSSSEYRSWSLDDWCEIVRSLNVDSLTAWANASRSTYNRAVALGRQREIARRLGWLPRLENGEMEKLTDDEFVLRFRERGVESITDMWRCAQHWCEFLRREERLEGVAERLGFGYVIERHPADLDYYLERCKRIGDIAAWCRLDKTAAEAARKHGLMEELRKFAPQRPNVGYPSKGGPCRSLPELAVARLLEANDIGFVTQFQYPFTFPRGNRRHSESDFYLTEEGAFVEVWSVTLDEESPFWTEYVVRRRFKSEMCRKFNLRLIEIEGALLFRKRPEIYLDHIHDVFSSAGIPLMVRLEGWGALCPEYVEKKRGEGD